VHLSSISAAITNIKGVRTIISGLLSLQLDADVRAKVGELETLIGDAHECALEAKGQGVGLLEQNAHLRSELQSLKARIETRESMIFRDNAYWKKLGGGAEEGPFCPKCLDGQDQRSARMKVRTDDSVWRCPVCDCWVEKPGLHPRITRALMDSDDL